MILTILIVLAVANLALLFRNVAFGDMGMALVNLIGFAAPVFAIVHNLN